MIEKDYRVCFTELQTQILLTNLSDIRNVPT